MVRPRSLCADYFMVTLRFTGLNICIFNFNNALHTMVILALCYFSASSSAANERAALVIGNQRYAVAALDTPEEDARAIADRLQKTGYQVTRLLNLRQTEFYDAVDSFFHKHKTAEVMLFFYAGHAVQINGKNFLIPVDVKKDDPDVLSRMFDLRYLMTKLTESKSETRLVVLDACRDNIFSSNPNAGSGLSELLSPPGTFVAFSTAPGSTAADGDGENSPYTTALLESLFRPKVKIEEAFKEVRRKVRFLTEDEQTPWESTSLVQDFYVVPANVPVPAAISARGKGNKKSKTAPPQVEALAKRVAVPISDKKICARILTKMSMGFASLSEDESTALTKCRQ